MSETDIKTEDIKKPKKLIMKIGNQLIVGAGGVSQGVLHNFLVGMGNASPQTLAFFEMVLSSVGAGAMKQKQLKKFLTGMNAGAAKDLVQGIWDSLSGDRAQVSGTGIMAKLKQMFTKKVQVGVTPQGVAVTPRVEEFD